MAKTKATVFIPTYNGERYIGDILTMLRSQKVSFGYEVLIIDSGSKDATLDIIAEHQTNWPELRLHKIPNTEFGHGKTRNLAAQMAKGEFVVYLSHDAVPAHDGWLHEMVRPFAINPQVRGVMGKQVPRNNCIPMLKYEIRSVFSNFGPDFGTTLFYKDSFVQDRGTHDAISFYSDVNSAGRREHLVGDMPYQDVRYAEDQLMGRAIVDAGYYKAYAARGTVVHSNDLTLQEYAKRMFDETMGLRMIGQDVPVPSRRAIAKIIVKGVCKDTVRILQDHDYSRKRKLYWLAVNPFFYIEKWRGVRRAALADINDTSVWQKYSLETGNKLRNKDN